MQYLILICMRLVFDTAMMVAAIRSETGSSRQLLLAGMQGRVVMLISVPLMFEYEAVLTRPTHLTAAGLDGGDIDILLKFVASIAEPVRLDFLWRPALRDPDDDMVLETAVNGRADAIVTFNTRDFFTEAKRFGIEILSPGETLNRLKPH